MGSSLPIAPLLSFWILIRPFRHHGHVSASPAAALRRAVAWSTPMRRWRILNKCDLVGGYLSSQGNPQQTHLVQIKQNNPGNSMNSNQPGQVLGRLCLDDHLSKGVWENEDLWFSIKTGYAAMTCSMAPDIPPADCAWDGAWTTSDWPNCSDRSWVFCYNVVGKLIVLVPHCPIRRNHSNKRNQV